MTLGQKIKDARISHSMTQKQLVGDHITRNMLSKIENDNATPSVRTLEYLAGKLGLPAGYFLDDATLSDGTAPDGLDEIRFAFREGRYRDCLGMLENAKVAGTTDEGYLLRSHAARCAAKCSLKEGNIAEAKEFADAADYYNKESIYYSAEIDAEMSLILAECALSLDLSEFSYNAQEFERAYAKFDFSGRYLLAQAEFLIKTGEVIRAAEIIGSLNACEGDDAVRLKYLKGLLQMEEDEFSSALKLLLDAEASAHPVLTLPIYSALEECYRQLGDFEMAYKYASLQLRKK